jgi:methylenetetrahydrofolate reductase (NADPH)
MADRIQDLLTQRRPIFSFELFPPKTPKGLEDLYRTVESLAALEPAYVSVTYGAGGSTRRDTLVIAQEVQRRFGLTTMHHLTLVNQTAAELREIIARIRDSGVRNVLALRGDPPPEMGGRFRKVEGGLGYAYELIDLVREIAGEGLGIGVAGYPEKHVECPDKETDTRHLKLKLDHGGQFVVTQFFFRNEEYSDYLARTARAGITTPIIPGVLPITDYTKMLRFAKLSGTYITEEIHAVFDPIKGDLPATLGHGTEFLSRQCADLLDRGAPGIHFYCLNKVEPTRTVWRRLRARAGQ